jgi:hypothetical protein
MNIREWELKNRKKQQKLLSENPITDIDKAINDLEMIITGIEPYSRWWRWGYIKSLRLAIKTLKKYK